MSAREEGLRAAVEALIDTEDRRIAEINARPDPMTGRHSTMRAFVLTDDLRALLAEHPATPSDPPKTLDTMRSLGYLPPAEPDAGEAKPLAIPSGPGRWMTDDEIADVKRKAAEQAWDEGWQVGYDDSGDDNPYRLTGEA